MTDGVEKAERTVFEVDSLIECHYEVVYRYAYRMTGCKASSEDITQETFLKAVRNYGQLRAVGAERGWLLTIARHEFGRWLQKRKSSKVDGSIAFELAEPESALGLPTEERDWVQLALGQIDEAHRQVLLMVYFEELSYADIAKALEIPIGTVMSRISRGKQQLKKALERLAPNIPDTPPKLCYPELSHGA